ncbi:MobV family relaxase [Enterobacter ludwigii]
MTNFAIMRCKKIKTAGSVAASLQHCFRERETLNANPELTPNNQHLAARSSDEAMGKLRELLPEKRRKDAVLAVEYVMTASPEWWQEASEWKREKFFERSLEWLEAKYGKDRVIVATVHQDELTPHLSAFVVPLTADGRLSAKEFVGNRETLRTDQSTYAQAVEKLGLSRGLRGSPANHQRVRTYYAAIQAPIEHPVLRPEGLMPQVLKKGLLRNELETPAHVAARITRSMHKAYAPALSGAQEARQAKEAARNMASKAAELQQQMADVQRYYDVLQQMPEEMRRQLYGRFLNAANSLKRDEEIRVSQTQRQEQENHRLAIQRERDLEARQEIKNKASEKLQESAKEVKRTNPGPKP